MVLPLMIDYNRSPGIFFLFVTDVRKDFFYSTHNICFHREIRKILSGYPFIDMVQEEGVIKNNNIFSKSIINR